MSADARFAANSGLSDWPLPALCRGPLIAPTRRLSAAQKTSLVDTFRADGFGHGVLTGIMRWRLSIDQSATAWKMHAEAYRDFPIVDTVSA